MNKLVATVSLVIVAALIGYVVWDQKSKSDVQAAPQQQQQQAAPAAPADPYSNFSAPSK